MMHGSIHLFEHFPQLDDAPVVRQRLLAAVPAPVRSRPLVGLIRNSRSYRNEHAIRKLPRPGGHEDIILELPRRRSELPAILARFAEQKVDFIAIDGGDGTVRDVLTCGAGAFGDSWPGLIILPAGKTNALAYDLGIPADWTLDQALAAARRGRCARRQPLVVSQRDNGRAQVRGFVLGGGAFTRAIALGQRSHDLGAFNTAVVGVTTVWSLLQALCGTARNAWRQGTPMQLRIDGKGDLPHGGGLPAEQRYMLFASTLRRFPAGLHPFGAVSDTLRLTVLDNAARGLLLRLGSVWRGRIGNGLRRRGFHALGAEQVELDIGDRFILDGEAFPAGQYTLSAGSPLRFIVP